MMRAQAWHWQRMLPHWRRTLWNGEDSRRLWSKAAPDLLHVYDAYNVSVQRSDATRLLIMSTMGGVYADLDVVPCARFEQALGAPPPPLTLVRDPWRGTAERQARQHVSNFFIASVPGHPFWQFALRRLAERQRHRGGTMQRTGPYFVDYAWKLFKRRNRNCPTQLLERTATILTHTDWQRLQFGAHHWTSAWHSMTDYIGSLSLGNESRQKFVEAGGIVDEGLLEWLGVDRTRDCPEAALDVVLNGTGAQRLTIEEYVLTPETKAARGNETAPAELYGLLVNDSLVDSVRPVRWERGSALMLR